MRLVFLGILIAYVGLLGFSLVQFVTAVQVPVAGGVEASPLPWLLATALLIMTPLIVGLTVTPPGKPP